MWSTEETKAQPIFRYPLMTGENHVTYNKGIKRYIMGNYSFIDEQGNPRSYHQTGCWPYSAMRSQLTLFEAPEPWGPWSLNPKNKNIKAFYLRQLLIHEQIPYRRDKLSD